VPRVYTVETESDATTTADDIIELDAAAEKPICVYGWMFGQSTDIKEAEEEQIRYRWIRGHTTSGSGGSAPTPRPLSPLDTAASFAAEAFNTTAASAGTGVNLYSGNYNLRIGDQIWLPEGSELWTSGADLLVCRLLAAPTDSVSMTFTVWVREYP